jgi:signal transduction histidine kinase
MTDSHFETADLSPVTDATPHSGAPRRLIVAAFALASSTSLLLLTGALILNWVTSKALQADVAALQRTSRRPMGTLFTVVQSSWDYYASPEDQTAYTRFSEALSLLPAGTVSAAGTVESARESLRKDQSAGAQLPPTRSSAQDLATALKALIKDGISFADRGDADVLSSIERYQKRAIRMTGWGLALGVAVVLGGLVYVRRIESVNSIQYDELLRERQKLKDLSGRLLTAQEQERKLIARELHDDIGQSLGALAMDASRAGTLAATSDEQLRAVVSNIQQTADRLLLSVRDLALDLRPSMLDDLGLPAALDWLARETSRRGVVEVALSVDGLNAQLPERFNTCIYRVVQEGLANASRHSGARNIDVKVQRSGLNVRIQVRDDGRGFDPKMKQGLGLLGAAERLSSFGGTLTIESHPGGGTSFVAQLPVPEEAQ